jgi:hypothetical protein
LSLAMRRAKLLAELVVGVSRIFVLKITEDTPQILKESITFCLFLIVRYCMPVPVAARSKA